VNSNPARFEELERRLLSVEKQNRRLKQLGAALLVLVTSLIVMGEAPSKKTVEANEFILPDSNGNVRAKLAVNPTRVALQRRIFSTRRESRESLTCPPFLVQS
jgi:hypothetical protein